MAKSPPEEIYRVGNVFAKVWVNKNNDGKTFRNVTLERIYYDDDDTLQKTNSLPLSDLPNAIYALELARDHVAKREAAASTRE